MTKNRSASQGISLKVQTNLIEMPQRENERWEMRYERRDETRQSKGERESAISEVGDVEKSKIENEFITTYEKHESYENPMQAAEGGPTVAGHVCKWERGERN